MANETNATTTATETTATQTNELDYKRLYEELQGKYDKLKTANDNTSREAAEYKRKERERMSEDEKRRAEAEEEKARYAETLKELQVFKYTAKLSKTIKDEKVLSEVARLMAEGDFEKALEKQAAYMEKYEKEIEARIKEELMQQNPSATAQSGESTVTRATIMAIQDPVERQAMIAKHLNLFS